MGLPPLPVFWTLADGGETAGVANLGTASGAGQVIVQGPNGAHDYVLQEAVDSPEFERAEQGTITKTFTDVPWDDSCTYMAGLARGTIQTDNSHPELGSPFTLRILSSRQKRQRGGKATISIVSESLSFDTPPDEFQVIPVELGIDILRHPRYRLALDPTISDITDMVDVPGDWGATVSTSTIKQVIVRAIQTYRDSPIFPSADNINGLFQNNIVNQFNAETMNVLWPNPQFDPLEDVVAPKFWDGSVANFPIDNCQYLIVQIPVSDPAIQFSLAAAKEIILKIWRMEDTPLLTGFEVTWSVYYTAPPYINPGSYVEDPISESNPALPDYFWAVPHDITWTPPREGLPDIQGPGTENSIFFQMASTNPQCYSDDGTDSGITTISWLRKADEIEFNRCWFKVTRKWLGASIGNWDDDLYNKSNRPNIDTFTNDPPTGYRQLTS